VVRRLDVDGAPVEQACAGSGVRAVVTVLGECEPRPVGDTAYLFAGAGARGSAEQLADQRSMALAFEDHRVSREELLRYGIPLDKSVGTEALHGQQQVEIEAEDENAHDDEGGEDRDAVVLKTDSGAYKRHSHAIRSAISLIVTCLFVTSQTSLWAPFSTRWRSAGEAREGGQCS
jgi:hypothetical protein